MSSGIGPVDKNKKMKEIYILLGILTLIIGFIALHGAVYMYEINEDNYFMAMIYSVTDMMEGNFYIFPWTSLSTKYLFFTICIILLIGAVWISDFWFKKDMMDSVEGGSTDWNTEMDKYNKKYSDPIGSSSYEGPKNMILSEDIRLSMQDYKTRRNNNILVIGGAGTGKSRFLCKPNMLQANCSFVITDPSGELLESQGKFLENQGYKVKVFNLIDMTHSSCYNPFHYIRDDLGVMILINCLIRNTDNGKKGGDPFWEKSETALLQSVMFYMRKNFAKDEQNFNTLLKMLALAKVDENNPDAESELDKLFRIEEENDPQSLAVKQYKIFKQGAGKTLKSILISTMVRLSHFNIKEISRLTRVDTLDLQRIGDEKTALFVVIPAADDTYNYLVSMMYSQLFESLYFHAENECGGRKRLPVDVRFLLDEFANIGQIPNFEKKLATMRKYGISCTIILQSLSQIKSLYKEDYQGIIGNCDTFLLLGTNDEETAKYVSDKLGSKTIRSTSISRNRRGHKPGSESNSRKSRKLMLPEEVLQMDNNKCIISIRGERPFMSNKYPLEKHKNYQLTADYDESLLFNLKSNPNFLIKDKMDYSNIKKAIIKVKAEEKVIGTSITLKEGELEKYIQQIDKTQGTTYSNNANNTEGEARDQDEENYKKNVFGNNYDISANQYEDTKKMIEKEVSGEEIDMNEMNLLFNNEPDEIDL